MKKMIVVAGLFYAATSGAMAGRFIVTVAAPVIASGLYHVVKSNRDQEEIEKKFKDLPEDQKVEREAELSKARTKLINYADGLSWGVLLPITMIVSKENLPYHSPIVPVDRMNVEQKVGFFAGLSSAYVALPAALSLVRKLKK